MQIQRLQVENYRSIGSADVEFEDGIVVIHGPNGAGKTSLIEAAFFALYGSDAVPGGERLGDVIRMQADTATVELSFTHGGVSYTIERTISGRERTDHTVTLTTPDGMVDGVRAVDNEVEGILRMDADAFLSCAYVRQGEIKLVEADGDDRKRLLDRLLQLGKLETYIERGNNALTGARRAHRETQSKVDAVQDGIDVDEDELQSRIDRIDNRIDILDARYSELSDEVEQVREKKDEIEDRIEEADDRRERMAELREEISDLDDEIDRLKDERATASQTRSDAEQQREEYLNAVAESLESIEHEDVPDDTEALCEDPDAPLGEQYSVAPISDTIADLRSKKTGVGEKCQEKKVEMNNLRNEAESLRSEASSLEDRASEKKDEAATAEEKAQSEIGPQMEAVETRIDELSSTVDDAQSKQDELYTQLEQNDLVTDDVLSVMDDPQSAVEAAREIKNNRVTEADRLRDEIEDAEELLAAGKCPECGQSVDGSPHVESLDDKREELQKATEQVDIADGLLETCNAIVDEILREQEASEEIADLRDDLDDLENRQDEAVEKASRLRDEAKELLEEASEKRSTADEKASKADGMDNTIAELEQREDTLADVIDVLSDVEEDLRSAIETGRKITTAQTRVEDLNDRIEKHESEQSDLQDELDRVSAEFDPDVIQEAREQLADIEEREKRILVEAEAVEEDLNDLRQKRGRVAGELEELQRKKKQVGDLRDRADRLESAVGHLEDLVAEYEATKADLRQRNIDHLERFASEIFADLYQSSTYERIEIDNDYNITIHDKAEGTFRPEQLSGGEKVLINLSIRMAIYRLLAESGSEMSGSNLPPMILDEPTAHLDDANRREIASVAEEMRDLGVGQIVVVSHEDEIVASSDAEIEVEIDESTNRSTASRSDSISPAI